MNTSLKSILLYICGLKHELKNSCWRFSFHKVDPLLTILINNLSVCKVIQSNLLISSLLTIVLFILQFFISWKYMNPIPPSKVNILLHAKLFTIRLCALFATIMFHVSSIFWMINGLALSKTHKTLALIYRRQKIM